MQLTALSQTETEPNNTFATASNFPVFNTYTATVGGGDAIDYHRVNLTQNANFYMLVEATNNSGNDAFLEMQLYDGRQGTGLLLTRTIGNNLNVPDGETVYDTIYVCAKAIDTYYLTFTTNEEFDYQLQWFPVAAYDTDEPNNNSGVAAPFAIHAEKMAAIRYEFRGGVNDTEDWFQSGVLPAGDYSDVKLYLEAWNSRCSGGPTNITYQVFKVPNLVTPFAQGLIGGTSSVPSGVTVNTVLPLSNMQAGDIFYVRLISTGPFGYTLKYTDQVPFDDWEDNCCYFNAIHLNEDSIIGGHVGEYDEENFEYVDEFDTYRIILPHDGAVKIYAVTGLENCGTEDPVLLYDILDEYGNEISTYDEMVRWEGIPACGDLRYDTIKIRAFAADTFFIRLYSSSWSGYPIINYNLRYELVDSTAGEPEPNNDTASAILITPGEVRKGHVNFKRDPYNEDNRDYYKINLPQDGKLKVYVKARYRGPYVDGGIIIGRAGDNPPANLYTWDALGVTYVNGNQSDYVPPLDAAEILSDSLYTDTLTFCSATAGMAYLKFESARAYEYEFWCELVDTLTWVNDTEPNNSAAQAEPVSAGQAKTGRLRYYQDRIGSVSDFYDYFITTTPSTGTLKIYVEATNATCNAASAIQITGFSNSGSTQVFAKNIAGLTTVPAGATIYDTISPCYYPASTLYLRMEAIQGFRYKIRYEVVPVDTAEAEPNNTFATSTRIGSGQNRNGFLGLTYAGQPDGNDYYKMIIPVADTFRLKWVVKNISCTDNRLLRIWGYNRNFNQVFLKGYVLNAVGTIDAGVTVADSLKVFFPGPDTLYIRFEGNGLFRYNFQTGQLRPSSWFTIAGDTTTCEGGTYQYRIANLVDSNVSFHWSLPAGGGTLSYTDSIASVVWNNNGNRQVQVYVSNSLGNSPPVTLNVVVNGQFPTQVPVVLNFARTLSTSSLPPGSTCQWYRNDTLIAGAVDSIYYASLAGTYTVKFVNDCGPGPSSNAITFPGDVQAQTINFPHIPTVTMSPTAKAALEATASSGLPVFYQKISGPATIVNDTLFITGVGTIIVKASQPGDDEYSAAAPVNDTITVVKGNQVITFDSIPPQIFNSTKLILTASSSMGQTITYTVVAGSTYASVGGNQLTKKGTGLVTVRASQNGNSNYNAAVPIERTFCIGVRTLTPITGDAVPCLNTYRYNTQKIPGANYEWTLSGGGILTTNNDTAWVQWQTPGTYTLSVKANGTCDTVYTSQEVLNITTSNNVPGMVSGMSPANGIINQQLPLRLSWIPGANTVNYDVYVWDSASTEPLTPFAANVADISYTIPKNAPLPYNRTYKWRVVAKNPCAQTTGSVQTFRLIPLPDLVISDIQAPPTATSGQTISISWKVTNIGPGNTLLDQSWEDGIYFTLDTVPNVNLGNAFPSPTNWNQLTAAGRPLLLGKKNRPASLDSGQFYTNSINFTLPVGYNFPVYVYGIAANNGSIYRLLQESNLNDTARAPNQIVITQPPLPDLRVDSVFTSASVFSGGTMNITYKVKNYGVVTPAGSTWIDSFFISQNPLFDRNQCILLNAPEANGSYYPWAKGAAAFNNTQLNANGTVTKTQQVVIPNFIFGTWFIYVKTNASVSGATLYEGAFANNNVNQVQLQVYLTPTPKLTVNALTIPVATASTTQPIGVNWEIRNEGFRDNIERSRGHYITMGTCAVPCPPGTPPNSSCVAPSVQRDSLVFGSSYWLDRVYLSTDSSGLNLANAMLMKEVKHGIENSGFFADPRSPYTSFVSCPALVNGNINVHNIIEPGASFPKAEGFTVPSDLQPGNYYIYVYTNPTKTVFEYPGTPQISRSLLPVTIQRPDVTVNAISTPANAFGGQTIDLNYSILNNGPGGVFNHQRRDRYYISNFSNFDGSAQLIGSQTFTEDLPVGTPVPRTFSYTIPPTTTGVKYFFVQTNYDSLFKETNATNNMSLSAGTLITAATPADLVVSSVQLPDSVLIQSPVQFTYTVINNGSGATIGNWTDSIFISCNPVFNASTAKFVTKRTQTRVLQAGGNYTDSFLYVIPKMSYEINSCFPQQMYAPGYFFVKTNANNGAFEGAATANNTTGSGNRVVINPLVDHVMVSASLNRDTISFGTPFNASWKVNNIGYKPTAEYYYFYEDGLYFSVDSVINANDVGIFSYRNYNTIDRNDSLITTRPVMPPDLPAGDYYVIAKTNYTNRIPAEKIFTNNNNFVRNSSVQAKKIHMVRPPLPDLVDTIVSAPTAVAMGQPFTVIYKVTNTGPAVTFPGAWNNQLRLSSDFQVQVGQHVLSNKTRSTPLASGASFMDTVTCTMPLNIAPGNYVIIGQANSNNAVPESSTANNLGFHFIEAQLPDSADLVVDNVLRPDTVYLGYTIDTAKWKIRNNSGVTVRGWMTDGLYLSKSNLLDSNATLVGSKYRYVNMLPSEQDSVKLTPRITTSAEGNYNLIVKTDLLNNIIELDKTNNTGVCATPIYVKAKELKLDIPEVNTLGTVSRYYALHMPDSLRGATVLVTLKTDDSLLVRNEMFIGGGFVPTAASYDYRYEIPNYGNQQIVISDVTDSVYYIMYRCMTASAPVQTVTLKAVVLPFAVLNVHTNTGGNIGNVTVRIRGTLFRDSMIAKLSNGTTTIYASAVYFTNSTQVYATFPLQGKPLGVYDVTLVKTDSTTAVLPGGFTIVVANNGGLITGGGTNTGPGNGNAPGCDPGAASGLNSQLLVEMIVPLKVVRRRPVVIVINFSNPTNFDLPVQSRILYNDEDVKMAFTKAGIPTGTSSLYIEFTEQGGPPGIIRPGGSGSIIVHCVAPFQVPEDRSVLFKLQ